MNLTDDIVLATLKKEYFALASKENIGHTPELTEPVDALEAKIRELEAMIRQCKG